MTRRCMRGCDGHHEKSDWVPSVNRFTVAPRAVRVALVGRNGVEQLLGVVADSGDERLPNVSRACVGALSAQLRTLRARILEFDRLITG